MSNESFHPFQSEAHYRRLRAKLVTFLGRRSCTASEDVADEALARLVKLANTRETEKIDAATFVIAKNVFHEWLRQSGRFVGLDDEPCGDATPGSQRFRLIAENAIRGLDPTDRDFLEQYFVDGTRAKDLASHMGTTQVAVRGRAFRLRRQLQVVVDQLLAEGAPAPVFARSRVA